MARNARRTEDQPHDRLTRITVAMTTAMERHPEFNPVTDKCIVMLDDGAKGGLQLFNYDDDTDAMVDLFQHLEAIFEANGKKLMLAPLHGSPEDN